jgi:hypothetical protein
MSKRNTKPIRKRPSLKYVGFGGFGFLLIAVAFLLFRGSSLGSAGEGTPELAVEQQVIDLGGIKDYTATTFTILITNSGTGTLRFIEKPYIQVIEGCCPPELTIGTMILGPGESTTITSAQFFMHPGMDGKHNFAVHLVTNDTAQADLVVNVLSDWIQ